MATCDSSRPTNVSYDRAALYHAVVEQEKNVILEILQHDVDWRLHNDDGETVLHLAFRRKYNTLRQLIEILEIFLELGMDVNIKNSIGRTAMHLAVRDTSKDVVEFLMNRGGDLNISDKRGNSIAHYLVIIEFERFRKYVSANASPNNRNYFERKSAEFICWLMDKGLDIECPNKLGITAFQLALKRNLQHVLPIFFKYAKDVNFVDKKNRTILHIFMEKKRFYKNFMKRYQIKEVAIPSWFYGTKYDIDIVRILLDKNISVDAVDNDGNTPFHIAAKEEESNILEIMLKKFTNVNACNKQGDTVLHIVIDHCMDDVGLYFENTVEVVRTLISKGADIHLRNGNGFTPVQLAATQKHFEILKVLEKHHADFRVLTSRGENLLHLISRNMKEMVSNMVYGQMVDLLVSKACDVNARDTHGNSPLHVAAEYGSLTVVKKLLQHGAKVDCREKLFQLTPLHKAVDYSHYEVIEELIKAGANINAKDASGSTPLHWAVHEFSERSIELLLKLGAHVDVQDKHGRLPLDKAIESDNPAGVKELLKYGADINDCNALGAAVRLNNNYMYHVLLDHWYKLKAAGLPCADDYMHYNEEEFKCSHNNFIEVQELKACIIDKRTSLYDFLHMNPNRKGFYVQTSTELGMLVNSPMLKLQFPSYYVLILASYREGLTRKKLLEPAKLAWYKLTNISLPDICLELILDNLSNVNLRLMVEGDDYKRLKRSSVRKDNRSVKKRRVE